MTLDASLIEHPQKGKVVLGNWWWQGQVEKGLVQRRQVGTEGFGTLQVHLTLQNTNLNKSSMYFFPYL